MNRYINGSNNILLFYNLRNKERNNICDTPLRESTFCLGKISMVGREIRNYAFNSLCCEN